MTDILEKAKEELRVFERCSQRVSKELIQEVERLRHALQPHPHIGGDDRLPRLLEIVNGQYCKQGKNIDWWNEDVIWLVQTCESLTKELEEAKKEIAELKAKVEELEEDDDLSDGFDPIWDVGDN